MARNQLIHQLLDSSQQAQTAIYSHMERSRKQGKQVHLHLREQHFLAATAECKRNTMTELAQMLAITPGAATQLAARLERKGYVTRQKSQADHRVTLVHLTEQGETLYTGCKSQARKFFRQATQAMEQFSDEDIALLIRYEEAKRALYEMD